jgi:hypothetical protein
MHNIPPPPIPSVDNFVCTSSTVLISTYHYFYGKICQKLLIFNILFPVAKNILVAAVSDTHGLLSQVASAASESVGA